MTFRIRISLACFAALVGLSTGSEATVHEVPGTFPTIQDAIDAAATGDTVQVDAGQYPESLTIVGKDLVMIGAGPHATVVRPAVPARVLRVGPSITFSATGFSFEDGRADQGAGAYVGEDAVCTFRSCRFFDNMAQAQQDAGMGGGVFVDARAQLFLRRCEIRDNFAAYSFLTGDAVGGGILGWAESRVDAESTAFARNAAAGFEGGFGGAVALSGEGSFRSCTFDSNFAGNGAGILSNGVLVVSSSVFRFNQSFYGASAISFFGTAFGIRTSVFHDNTSLGSHTVSAQGSGTIESNTFAFNRTENFTFDPQGSVAWEGDETIVRNNIVAQNRQYGLVSYSAPSVGAVSCNDVWRNRDGNYGGALPDLTGQDDNLSVVPPFCDSTARNLGLAAGSPLISYGACGLIGALPAGCVVTGVDPAPARVSVELLPARPHPWRGDGMLAFTLPTRSRVRLEVLDVTGRRVAVVHDGWLPRGRHEQSWSARRADGSAIPAGVYLLRLEAGGVRRTQRLVILGR